MSNLNWREQRALQQRIADFEQERAQQARADERQRAQWQRENEQVRERREAKMAADEQAQRDADDAADEVRLAPRKAIEMRAWLASHPDKSAADFDKLAWQHLKLNILEQERAEARERLKQRMRSEF